jgi:hypothetical protein
MSDGAPMIHAVARTVEVSNGITLAEFAILNNTYADIEKTIF